LIDENTNVEESFHSWFGGGDDDDPFWSWFGGGDDDDSFWSWFGGGDDDDPFWQSVFNGAANSEPLPGEQNPNNPNTTIKTQIGTGIDDIFGGFVGNDDISGGDGDDLIDGGDGDDTLKGDAGNDSIFGFNGNDKIYGGTGNDFLSGESGSDAIYGEAGADVVSGGGGDDFLSGGEGRDFLIAGTGDDAAFGGAGDDLIQGEAGSDLLVGEDGRDMIEGGHGNDLIFGDSYQDTSSFDINLNNLRSQFNIDSSSNNTDTSDSNSENASSDNDNSSNSGNENNVVLNEWIVFQQGVNGYSGTVDTYIHGNNPNANNSSSTSLNVDSRYRREPVQGLIRFDDIFGSQTGQIALDDTINSAVLEIDVSNRGNSLEVYELLQSWTDTATWNSWENGIQTNGTEAKSTSVATTGYVNKGILTIDVTASLQAWQADPTSNYGWAFLPTDTNNVEFDSAEGTNAPRLLVNVEEATSDSYYNDNYTDNSSDDSLTISTVRFEAENMTLDGYQAQTVSFASGGSLTKAISADSTVTATTTFTGASGFYDVIVAYHDENDGVSEISVTVGGVEADKWLLDQDLDNSLAVTDNFVTRTVAEGLVVNEGDEIFLQGIADTGEYAQIDYIEFVPVESANVQLSYNSDILRGGGGNDVIFGDVGDDIIYGEDEFDDGSVTPVIPEGYTYYTYGQSTYVLSSATTWEAAQTEAQSLGGNLVTINDAAEEDWLKQTFGTSEELWIGLTDKDTEGTFTWASGEAVTYTNWVPGEPNSHSTSSDYVRMNFDNSDSGWGDLSENYQRLGIIEIDWSVAGGNDVLVGGSGNDIIYGNSGNDVIFADDYGVATVNQGETSNTLDGDDALIFNYTSEMLLNDVIFADDYGVATVNQGKVSNTFDEDDALIFNYTSEMLLNDGDSTFADDYGLAIVNQRKTSNTFDGDDALIFNHTSEMLLNDGTLSFSFQANDVSEEQGLFSKDSMGYDDGGHLTVNLDDEQLTVRLQSINSNYTVETFVNSGQEYDVAIAFGSRGLELWLDGNLVDINTYTGGLGNNSGGGGNYEPIVLGASQSWSSDLTANNLIDYFTGTLKDVRLYDQQLSGTEISQLSTNPYTSANMVFEELIITKNQLIGGSGNDELAGGAGDDTLNGTDDIAAGVYEHDVLIGGAGADTFILGDATQSYYLNPDNNGNQDYAVIQDFLVSEDVVQLHGVAGDYQTQVQGSDVLLSRSGDLVAIFEDVNSLNISNADLGLKLVNAKVAALSLNLDSAAFQYV
uniref:DNRLRE domain-containing protein n=1 Tax=Calothrix rhizosoleniae TaxID=888997 RepID=UPI0011774F71